MPPLFQPEDLCAVLHLTSTMFARDEDVTSEAGHKNAITSIKASPSTHACVICLHRRSCVGPPSALADHQVPLHKLGTIFISIS